MTQLHRRAAIVEHAVLVLAEPVERFRDRGRKAVRDAVGVFSIEFDRLVGSRDAVAFVQQRFSTDGAKCEIAALDIDDHLKLSSLYTGRLRVLRKRERRSRDKPAGHRASTGAATLGRQASGVATT